MISKTLFITCDLFDAAARIEAQLGAEEFAREFLPRLRRIHDNLVQGPNPDLSIPLVDALEWGFHSPIQPVIETLIHAQRFDWRFITGRRRRFRALAPGQPVPPALADLWQKALARSTQVTSRNTP
ncbi:MAG: hypothetical protein HQL64_08575 [Magnetococcales bacterium]|nr:hypothetical protein [Magnetococcales bacterium]